jgi:epoxyqueuosine reductase
MNLNEQIKQKAFQLGFDLVGVTDAAPIDAECIKHIRKWLKAGCAGQMKYLHKNLEKRFKPSRLLKGAKSVICVAVNYNQPKNIPSSTNQIGRVAAYAQYEDYHLFIKKQLYKLVEFITEHVDGNAGFKICAGSAPVAEKAFAKRAGLGFIGKNHLLINPCFGCKLLLGEIITSLKLQTDKPINGNCADCGKCITACPTAALAPDGLFDARKCISYLTIEYKAKITRDLAEKIGNRLFGCDECIFACPYQKTAPIGENKFWRFFPERAEMKLKDILKLNQQQFETRFADSPIKRCGLEKLKSNAEICLNNVRTCK